MKSRTAIQICSTAILVCFFFPLFQWHGFEMSGLNYILSDQIPSYKYVFLLIPFSALFLFWGAAGNNKYIFDKRILSFLPLISLVIISIARFTDDNNNSYYDRENPFLNIALGFWLLLFFSLLLLMVKDEKKKTYAI